LGGGAGMLVALLYYTRYLHIAAGFIGFLWRRWRWQCVRAEPHIGAGAGVLLSNGGIGVFGNQPALYFVALEFSVAYARVCAAAGVG
jgi:hypothetical protein